MGSSDAPDALRPSLGREDDGDAGHADPDQQGDRDDGAQRPVDRCVGHEEADRGDHRQHQLDADVEHAAGGDRERGVAERVPPRRQHPVAHREVARPRHERRHGGRTEVGDHAATNRQVVHHRGRLQALRGDPHQPRRRQRDHLGIVERAQGLRRSRRRRGRRRRARGRTQMRRGRRRRTRRAAAILSRDGWGSSTVLAPSPGNVVSGGLVTLIHRRPRERRRPCGSVPRARVATGRRGSSPAALRSTGTRGA